MDCRDKHPAGIDADAPIWYGVEVEGVHRGKPAAFLAAELTTAERQILRGRIERGLVKVVFLTETFEAWGWLQHWMGGWGPVTLVAGRMPHQLAAFFQLPAELVQHVQLIVRVFDAPWVRLLRPKDQVSVGVPYDLRTFHIAGSVLTVPADYEKDRG